MRTQLEVGNPAADVSAGNPNKSNGESPERLAMSKNGLQVRVGSIIKHDGDVGEVTYLENDSFIAKTMEFNSVHRIVGYCEDREVLSKLAATYAPSNQHRRNDVNADTNGNPIRVGDTVYEEGNPDVVGKVEVVHDGGCIYRIISAGKDRMSLVGTCCGFQCRDLVLQFRPDDRPAPLPIHPAGKAIDAVKRQVDEIRATDPTVDDTGRPIKIGDIVCVDGPEYGRVEHVMEGCALVRMFNWYSPDDRELVDWKTSECTIVDTGTFHGGTK